MQAIQQRLNTEVNVLKRNTNSRITINNVIKLLLNYGKALEKMADEHILHNKHSIHTINIYLDHLDEIDDDLEDNSIEISHTIEHVVKSVHSILDYTTTKEKIDRIEKEFSTYKTAHDISLDKINLFIRLLNLIPKYPEHKQYIKQKLMFLNNNFVMSTLRFDFLKESNAYQKIKNYIGPLPKINISKVRRIQSAFRTKQAVQNRYVDSLLSDMQRNQSQNFGYYINKINKVYRKIPDVLKHPRLNRNVITTQIAPCHIKPGKDPRVYLKELRSQLLYAAKLYHQKKVRDAAFKEKFLARLKSELGGRPCLENLIEGLSVALSDPEFEWKGRKIAPLEKNNSRYLKLLTNTFENFRKHHANQKNAVNLPMSHQRRIKMFWNMIKNQNLYVITTNRHGQKNVGYQRVKNYNRNGTRFKSSNAANWLQYIGRKNEKTKNFLKKKAAVNKIESAYKKRVNSRPRRLTRAYPLRAQKQLFK